MLALSSSQCETGGTAARACGTPENTPIPAPRRTHAIQGGTPPFIRPEDGWAFALSSLCVMTLRLSFVLATR